MMKCKTNGCEGSIVLTKTAHIVKAECLECGTIFLVTDRATWEDEVNKILYYADPGPSIEDIMTEHKGDINDFKELED